jgi:SAM domain (Sterile alpha motif)
MRPICCQPQPTAVLRGVHRYDPSDTRKTGNIDTSAEHGIVGEALIALKHDELKEMGIASVGHRLTILKQVYEMKAKQDIAIEPDDYIPLCKRLPLFLGATLLT